MFKSLEKKMIESIEKKNLRSLLTLDDTQDYELEQPKEKIDFTFFGDGPTYLTSKKLPPLKVYIYGNYPHFEKATAYFMLQKAKVEFSSEFKKNYYDIGWFWDARITVDKTSKKCREFSEHIRFINLFLIDTSKEFVARAMEQYFGYSFKIDPKTFDGYCIAKHNGNGTKSCFFLKCPINADEIFHDHCYQKIINFSCPTDKNTLYEIRVPIFKYIIPFTFFKTRNKGLRFTSKNRSMDITPATKHLSEEECQKILSYCRKIGLEYGELDILRCDETNQIYIIDVNNTAWWPPNKLENIERNIALNMMWNAWLEVFLPDKFNDYHIPDEFLDDYYDSKNTHKNNRVKKDIKYNEYKFVGKQYEFPYETLWKELNRKFLNRPKPKEEKKKDDKKKDKSKNNSQKK